MTMKTTDRKLASARSAAKLLDSRKDERRAYVRAVRRAGRITPRDLDPDDQPGE